MVVGCQPLTGESMRWIKDTVSGLSTPHEAAARNRVTKVRGGVTRFGDFCAERRRTSQPTSIVCVLEYSFAPFCAQGLACHAVRMQYGGLEREHVL